MRVDWISVEDQLPERQPAIDISHPVLCACLNHPVEGGHFQKVLYYDHEEQKWFINHKTPVAWSITDWMPLPAPPSPR